MENNLIKDQQSFNQQVTQYLETVFSKALKHNHGEIEIRVFKGADKRQSFFDSIYPAATTAYDLCQQGIDVYCGVNTRVGKGGKKSNVKYINSFHAEIDYGTLGHNKKTEHATHDDALKAIKEFPVKPTIIVHSGGGFHCYWVLDMPIEILDQGDCTIETIEGINLTLCKKLGGDVGTQDISRVLRVPGTYNFKDPDNPREVTITEGSDIRYDFETFRQFIPGQNANKETRNLCSPKPEITYGDFCCPDYVNGLPISDKIKFLIMNGNDGSYPSRSEADMAVILSLVNKGIGENEIKKIFESESYHIGEKYRNHGNKDSYLKHNIKKAKEFSNLSEDEMQNPLFISGALYKTDKGIVKLDVVRYQEYITKKYRIKKIEDVFFRYNGKCYEVCTEDKLNSICQRELFADGYRRLFTKKAFSDFLHYATGIVIESGNKVYEDKINYLTLQNGLYSLTEEKLINHSPEIFTTNLLMYDYDQSAICPRFLQYLDEVFLSDKATIGFVQESVGYVLHKSIPIPALFFLIGNGSNGKSVFTDVITDLFSEHNTCSISLNSLADEYYLFELCDKMLNVSGETPHKKKIASNIIKQVTAGDLVTARSPHKPPVKFRPYAKHFLAMNENPVIDDNSHGMRRRLYLIEFPHQFTKNQMDVDLRDKLKTELPGIFNWALSGYKRLRSKEFKLQETHSMETYKQQYMIDNV